MLEIADVLKLGCPEVEVKVTVNEVVNLNWIDLLENSKSLNEVVIFVDFLP